MPCFFVRKVFLDWGELPKMKEKLTMYVSITLYYFVKKISIFL